MTRKSTHNWNGVQKIIPIGYSNFQNVLPRKKIRHTLIWTCCRATPSLIARGVVQSSCRTTDSPQGSCLELLFDCIFFHDTTRILCVQNSTSDTILVRNAFSDSGVHSRGRKKPGMHCTRLYQPVKMVAKCNSGEISPRLMFVCIFICVCK